MGNAEIGLQEQILATAKDLFVNKGYHGLSMREISDALGVSKAALYYHFRDKEGLFLAILKIYLDDLSVVLDRILCEPEVCSKKISAFIHHVLTQPGKQRATIRLASQEIVHLNNGARSAFDQVYHEQFIDKIGAIFQAGIDTGEFYPVRVDVAVWALLGMMFPYFFPDHAGDLPVPTETIDQVVQICLTGLCRQR